MPTLSSFLISLFPSLYHFSSFPFFPLFFLLFLRFPIFPFFFLYFHVRSPFPSVSSLIIVVLLVRKRERERERERGREGRKYTRTNTNTHIHTHSQINSITIYFLYFICHPNPKSALTHPFRPCIPPLILSPFISSSSLNLYTSLSS